MSRRFVALSQQQLEQWLIRQLDDLDLAVMIDGIRVRREHVALMALGIDAQRDKNILGLSIPGAVALSP